MESLKIVTFRLGKEEFGIAMENVISIERLKEIVQVPHTANFVRGILELRGDVIPVIDLRTYMINEQKDNKEMNRVVVVQANHQRVGFLVDEATGIIDVPNKSMQHVPISGLKMNGSIQVANIENRMIMLIDVQTILLHADVTKALEEVSEAI
jgi:purine-binding chemotaxis protein CheW